VLGLLASFSLDDEEDEIADRAGDIEPAPVAAKELAIVDQKKMTCHVSHD
jgi:hypothetical protein